MEERIDIPFHPPYHLHNGKYGTIEEIRLTYVRKSRRGLYVWKCPSLDCPRPLETTDYIPMSFTEEYKKEIEEKARERSKSTAGCLVWLVILLLPFLVVACGLTSLFSH